MSAAAELLRSSEEVSFSSFLKHAPGNHPDRQEDLAIHLTLHSPAGFFPGSGTMQARPLRSSPERNLLSARFRFGFPKRDCEAHAP